MNSSALDILTDNTIADEQIDELFNALATYEPPANLVERIMREVDLLPRHQPALPTSWGNLDQLMILCDRSCLS